MNVGHRRRGISKITNTSLAAIVLLAFLLFATPIGPYLSNGLSGMLGLSTVKTPSGGTGGGSQGVSCDASSPWVTVIKEAAYGSDTLAGTVSINGYQVGNPNIAWADLTGASSPVTSSGTYAPDGSNLFKITETSTITTYPIWFPFSASGTVPSKGVVIASMGGLPVASLMCAPASSNSAANNWVITTTPLQAPTTGTSATTYAAVLVTASSGLALAGGGHSTDGATPTTSTRFDVYLQIKQAYKAALFPTTIYGSQSAALTNFGTISSPSAGVSTNSGSAQVGGYLIVSSNQTGISVQLDPAASQLVPGAGIVSVNNGLLSAGTRAWIIGPLPGCAPSTTAAAYNCVDIPLDIYETASQGTSHIQMVYQVVDMQQGGFLLNNYVTAAKTSFPSSGAAAGTPTGFSGLVSTTGSNAANPAALINQYYTTETIY